MPRLIDAAFHTSPSLLWLSSCPPSSYSFPSLIYNSLPRQNMMCVHFVTVSFTGFTVHHSSIVTFSPLTLDFFYSTVIKSIVSSLSPQQSIPRLSLKSVFISCVHPFRISETCSVTHRTLHRPPPLHIEAQANPYHLLSRTQSNIHDSSLSSTSPSYRVSSPLAHISFPTQSNISAV